MEESEPEPTDSIMLEQLLALVSEEELIKFKYRAEKQGLLNLKKVLIKEIRRRN